MADITIKLNNSLCARGFSSDERIHNNAFDRTVGMINKQIIKAEITMYVYMNNMFQIK